MDCAAARTLIVIEIILLPFSVLNRVGLGGQQELYLTECPINAIHIYHNTFSHDINSGKEHIKEDQELWLVYHYPLFPLRY